MVTLSSGPLWRLVVEAGAEMWAADVAAITGLRSPTIAAGPDGLEVAAQATRARVTAAWALTEAAGWFVAADPAAFAGVGLTVALPGLTVLVPADVLAGVSAGQGRRWWARRVAVRVGQVPR